MWSEPASDPSGGLMTLIVIVFALLIPWIQRKNWGSSKPKFTEAELDEYARAQAVNRSQVAGSTESSAAARAHRLSDTQPSKRWSKDWWVRYRKYLASPAWERRRMQILTRDNYVCGKCHHRRATEVHHLSYDRMGHERDSDLISVCPTCHDKFHPEKKLRRRRGRL
jgi:5-methylcytosine-specific restriction endonuclease McrA